MAARSWAQFDYDLAHPKSKREKAYDELCRFGVNGEVPLKQARINAGLDVPAAANDNEPVKRRKAAV
ncbi:hypothetical protein [Nitrobacter hamburgensis]|nr:hypothetical protein [Nitrobacter hamburgensis]